MDSIGSYYLENLVNPNNFGIPHSDEIITKIESLRKLILDRFKWTDQGHIVFLPNLHYAKLILLNYFSDICEESDVLFSSLSEEINKSKYENWKQEIGKYLVLEVFSDNFEYLYLADAFIFNIMAGVTVLGFKKGMRIKPLFFGAGSVEYADKKLFKLKSDFRILECGTMNVPLLLGLEDYYKNKIRINSLVHFHEE